MSLRSKRKEADAILKNLTAEGCLNNPSYQQYPRVKSACRSFAKTGEKLSAAKQALADADTTKATTDLIKSSGAPADGTAPADVAAGTGATTDEKFLGMPKMVGYAVVGVGSLVVIGVIGYFAFGSKSATATA